MRRLPALDGLRGVAIVLVLVGHLPKSPFGFAGSVGVTMFFVLSGFLITRVLTADETINYRRFYKRRATRLFPALALMLAALPIMYGWNAAEWWGHVWPTVTYTANYVRSAGVSLVPLTHTWSLAVEEHFYLLWPLVVSIIPTRRRVKWIAVLVVGFVGWRLVNLDGGFDRYYFGTDTNAYALLAGCLLAVTPRRTPPRWAATVVVPIVGMALTPVDPRTIAAGVALMVAAGLSVVAVWACTEQVVQLEWPTLRYLGIISYGLYLWHYPIMHLALHPAAMLAVTFAAAATSWRYVERPLLASHTDLDRNYTERSDA